VAQLSTSGALVYSSVFGGNGPDTGYAIAVDTSGNAYITGSTKPYGNGPWIDFPTTSDAFNVVELATRPGSWRNSAREVPPSSTPVITAAALAWQYGTAIRARCAGQSLLSRIDQFAELPVTSGAVQTKPGEVAATLIRRICTRMPATHSSHESISRRHNRSRSRRGGLGQLKPNFVSPGEIVSFFGAEIGPAAGVEAVLDATEHFLRYLPASEYCSTETGAAPVCSLRSVNAVRRSGWQAKPRLRSRSNIWA